MSSIAKAPPASLQDIAQAASRAETRSHAIDLAIAAFGDGIEAPLVLLLVSEGLEQDRRLEDAAAVAHRSTEVNPQDMQSWLEFSRLLLRIGQRSDAAEAANAAVNLDPESFDARMAAATALLSLNAFSEAVEHAERASAIRPTAAEPLSMLAIIHTRMSKFAAARTFAERALKLRPDLPGAEIALARVEMTENRTASAADRLRRVLSSEGIQAGHRAEGLMALGDALDELGEPGRAFACYTAGNQVIARGLVNGPTRGARRAVEHAAELQKYFRNTSPKPWREGAGDDQVNRPAAAHVFLVGFPRSGTTLLENALARHPNVLALEETDALALCAGDLFANSASLDRLAVLSPTDADACREIYWRRVNELLGEPTTGKVVIDKLPIGSVVLPLIAKLFPSAKVIFARRDPRDVILSCFRRLFGMNEVMAEFFTLESTTNYYITVMSLVEIYTYILSTEIHFVRHEDVVDDFDRELGKVLTFLGLGWDPLVRDFASWAIKSRTPSATQLALGLNNKGVEAWRRFARQLSTVLPRVEPWAIRFGYAPAGGASGDFPDERFDPVRASIVKALNAGDWQTVFALTDRAIADGFRHEMLYRCRGVCAQNEGRLTDAIADFETALRVSTADAPLLNALGLCLARVGRSTDAITILDEAIAIDPNFSSAHFNRGFALETVGDVSGAAKAYLRASKSDTANAAALGALAVLATRRADWSTARQYAERALAIANDLPSAVLALASVQSANGESEGAESRLRDLLSGRVRLTPHEEGVAQVALGDVLDRRGAFEDAFHAYQAASEKILAVHGARFDLSGSERASRLLDRLLARVGDSRRGDWNCLSVPTPPPDAAFLVGFPRSGTTMLGQALGLHSQIFTLDERDTLTDSIAAFYTEAGGLDRLVNLTDDDAQGFREKYLSRARALGWPIGEALLIDKGPSNTLALPIISQIFPAQKIIFLSRDPRDVVLSCFRRQFAINSVTIEFLDLQSTAALYDKAMRLFTTSLDKLALNIRIQRYESLVENFDSEIEQILKELNLAWEPAVADFSRTSALVATPSSAQLARGLTGEGVGAWRSYKFALEPVLAILEPWVEYFNYDKE